MSRTLLVVAFMAFLAVSGGCSETPTPPEVLLAERQQEDLRTVGVVVYAPLEFQTYREEVNSARLLYQQEMARWRVLRDYESVAEAFRVVLSHGEALTTRVRELRAAELEGLRVRGDALAVRLGLLRGLSETLHDRRLVLAALVQVELQLGQFRRLIDMDQGLDDAKKRLDLAENEASKAVDSVRGVLKRYTDRQRIGQWRDQAAKALAENRSRGGDLLLVSKIERRLSHYRNGQLVSHYEVGMGFHFLSDKLYSGDLSTPEGVYQVVRKVPGSKFSRALLLDYPNLDDRRHYAEAKRLGQIPKGAGIGGLIEIHGGSRQKMTDGCVALDNHDMEILYNRIGLQTPVIIVGTTDYDNLIAQTLARLE